MEMTLEQVLSALDSALENLQTLKNSDEVRKASRIGCKFKLADIEWIVLDKVEGGYLCLTTQTQDYKYFEYWNNGDWKQSGLRNYLNGEFYENLISQIGTDIIIPFTRDLTAVNGAPTLGDCEDKVSLLSFDEYRKYRELAEVKESIWTITSWEGSGTEVCVVRDNGRIYGSYTDNYNYVRPLVVLSLDALNI